ncbi:hypothetical protein AAMO2058_001075800 [Amorphochlora amoebiformis]
MCVCVCLCVCTFQVLWRNQLRGVFAIWEKATQNALLFKEPAKMEGKGLEMGPVDSFVYQEMDRTWRLVSTLKKSLEDLDSVLYKTGILTSQIESDGKDLLQGKVPWQWAKLWWGPEEPKAWIREVIMRKIALHSWIERAQGGNLLSTPLRLGDLFQIKVFLNSLRQQTARLAKVPIGELELFCTLEKTSLPASAVLQVEVTGLYIQGSCITNGQLTPIRSTSSPSLSVVPNCRIAWIPAQNRKDETKSPVLALPMYFMGNREELICELGMPCPVGFKRPCILAGTALFISASM